MVRQRLSTTATAAAGGSTDSRAGAAGAAGALVFDAILLAAGVVGFIALFLLPVPVPAPRVKAWGAMLLVPFAVAAAAGLQNTPYAFALENSRWKLIFELEARAPKESRRLFVKRILDREDREVIPGEGREEDYRSFIAEHFAEALLEGLAWDAEGRTGEATADGTVDTP